MNRKEFLRLRKISEEDDARRTKGVFKALEKAIALTYKRAERFRAEWRQFCEEYQKSLQR